MKLESHDPRLTAYALGELDPTEMAAVEAALRDDPAAQQTVAAIRQLSHSLRAEFAAETAEGLAPEQRAIVTAFRPRPPFTLRLRRALNPTTGRVVGGLALAASLLIGVLVSQPDRRDHGWTEPKPQAPTVATAPPAHEHVAHEESPAGVDGDDKRMLSAPPKIAALATEDGVHPTEPMAPPPTSSAMGRQMLGQGTGTASADLSLADVETDELARVQSARPPFNSEAYAHIQDNPFLSVAANPLSTFSIDVDTAAYANMRRFLRDGMLPPKDAVRIEELVNYFPYRYTGPTDAQPFATHVEIASAPWKPTHRLVRVALKGKVIPRRARANNNFVFLLDVSGSMGDPNKLPLLKQSLRLLTQQLTADDHVAMVVYAGASGLVLPSTPGNQKAKILAALDRLEAGGSTNGGEGIQLAYRTAVQHFIQDGNNRVILATDGDFNVGTTSAGDLVRLIEAKAKSGVFLSVLGFGEGNLNDAGMEQLADKGNGNYAYIDSLNEARKVLVQEMHATLNTIAKDVKIQVEFNPAKVAAYRLIGYENRALHNEDFNDDTKDAGEIGEGHTVTAFYDVVPVGVPVELPGVDPLKYQTPTTEAPRGSGELLTVKLRYKEPAGNTSQLITVPATDSGQTFEQASEDFRFAASVAGFGMLLRESPHHGTLTFDAVAQLATRAKGNDADGYRQEFLDLVTAAKRLAHQARD